MTDVFFRRDHRSLKFRDGLPGKAQRRSVFFSGFLKARKQRSRNGRSLHQRGGKLWTWETMVYLAGYGDGADFAGSCLVSEPARFAGAALIGGAPQSYAAGARVSSHPFLRSVSEGYCRKNAEIPVAVWFYGASEAQKREALAGFPEGSRQVTLAPWETVFLRL